MRLIAAIVHNDDAGPLLDALRDREYRATRINSSGGFLRRSNAMILVGVEDGVVPAVLEIIGAQCQTRTEVVSTVPPFFATGLFGRSAHEVTVGGATVFVLPVERFERL